MLHNRGITGQCTRLKGGEGYQSCPSPELGGFVQLIDMDGVGGSGGGGRMLWFAGDYYSWLRPTIIPPLLYCSNSTKSASEAPPLVLCAGNSSFLFQSYLDLRDSSCLVWNNQVPADTENVILVLIVSLNYIPFVLTRPVHSEEMWGTIYLFWSRLLYILTGYHFTMKHFIPGCHSNHLKVVQSSGFCVDDCPLIILIFTTDLRTVFVFLTVSLCPCFN